MSESNQAHLEKVLDRWAKIHTHLNQMKNDFPGLREFLKQNGAFSSRYHRQVLPIHIAAFFLSPQHWTTLMDASSEAQTYEFFNQYTESEDRKTIRTEFQCFRNQLHPFEAVRVCWEHANEPRIFWLMQLEHTKIIGKLAVRIYSTPANSVPSERSFSCQNFIHDKKRNRLGPEKVDKLTYIYMNTRVLNDVDRKPLKSVHALTEKEKVEMEDMLLQKEDVNGEDSEDEYSADDLEEDSIMEGLE